MRSTLPLRLRKSATALTCALVLVTMSLNLPAQVPSPRSVSLGPGCGSPAPTLTFTAPALGDLSAIQIASEFPDTMGFLFASAPPSSFVEYLPGCFIYLDPFALIPVTHFTTDSQGDFLLGLAIPDLPSLAGLEYNFQAGVWAANGPGGGDHMSNGVGIRVGDCDSCNGKITELVLGYRGSEVGPLIQVKQKNGTIVFSGTVNPGEEFSFSGLEANGTFGNEIKIRVNGGPETKIHTSCSKPVGPGLVVGDFEVIEGRSLNGGPLCPTGLCARGKPCGLRLRYTGGDCSGTQHSQDPSKVSCSGDPASAASVFIRASDKANPNDSHAKIWFEGLVNLGDSFELSALAAGENKLKSRTFLHVWDASGSALLQQVEFHTSCSQPLHLLDQFGAFRVEDLTPEGNCTAGSGGNGGANLCDGNKAAILTMEYTGESCAASVNIQDPSKVFCSGDPAGEAVVYIRASDKADPSDPGARVWFSGTVGLNQLFDIAAATAGESRLRAETHVHIYDASGSILLQQLEFHTSCSQPLRVNDQFGSLVLRVFTAE